MSNVITRTPSVDMKDEISSSTRLTFQYLGPNSVSTEENVAIEVGCILFDVVQNRMFVAAGKQSDGKIVLVPMNVDVSSLVQAVGGTLTNGVVILKSDPTRALEAATKQYVDNADSNITSTLNQTITDAKTDAINIASEDATTKANAAQSSALTSAKEYTDTSLGNYSTTDETSKLIDDKLAASGAGDTKSYATKSSVDELTETVTTLQTTVTKKNTIFRADSAPTATSTNDVWIDSGSGNRLMLWDGTSWVSVQDTAIATAITHSDENLQTAKNYTDEKIAAYQGSVSEETVDSKISTALDAARSYTDTQLSNAGISDTAARYVGLATISTSTSDTITLRPAGTSYTVKTGDLATDIDSYVLRVWNGTEWKSVPPTFEAPS